MTIPLLVFERNLNNVLLLKLFPSNSAGLESKAPYLPTNTVLLRHATRTEAIAFVVKAANQKENVTL
jgi:hypothetical protein